jgi:hypothetical protein
MLVVSVGLEWRLFRATYATVYRKNEMSLHRKRQPTLPDR